MRLAQLAVPIKGFQAQSSLLFPWTEIGKLPLIAAITAAANQMQIVVVVL